MGHCIRRAAVGADISELTGDVQAIKVIMRPRVDRESIQTV
jgi:hypothetical protein